MGLASIGSVLYRWFGLSTDWDNGVNMYVSPGSNGLF
jgi:hypothetical protein